MGSKIRRRSFNSSKKVDHRGPTKSSTRRISRLRNIRRLPRRIHTLQRVIPRSLGIRSEKTEKKTFLPKKKLHSTKQQIPPETTIQIQKKRLDTIQPVEKKEDTEQKATNFHNSTKVSSHKEEPFHNSPLEISNEKNNSWRSNTASKVLRRKTHHPSYTLQVVEFEQYCEQRCTDEEDTQEENDSDDSDPDSIEQEDIMEEISGEEGEWAEY